MAEVLIPVKPQTAVFYDPETHTPDESVFVFPLSTDWPEGTEVKLANFSDSSNPVIFRAQGSDLIANPADAANLLAEHSVSNSQGIQEYMKFGNVWHLSQSGRPKLANQVLQLFSFASYANLKLSTPPVAAGDIDATWRTIAVFDADVMPPRGIVTNISNGSMAFQYDGIYRVSATLNYTHDESNASRETRIRMWNVTDAVPLGNEIIIPVSRNQPATLISLNFMIPIADADKGKEYVLQIGGGDTLTAVSVQAADWSANAISEWRDSLENF